MLSGILKPRPNSESVIPDPGFQSLPLEGSLGDEIKPTFALPFYELAFNLMTLFISVSTNPLVLEIDKAMNFSFKSCAWLLRKLGQLHNFWPYKSEEGPNTQLLEQPKSIPTTQVRYGHASCSPAIEIMVTPASVLDMRVGRICSSPACGP